MSQIANSESKSWDLTPPVIPPRSRLISLKPIGVGTIFVESLTSYITRLADAHSVTAESLFGIELIPLVNRPYLQALTKYPRLIFTFLRAAHGLNGMGIIAKDWSTALEALTLRDDLQFLTLLTWRYLLTDIKLLRKTRAWCPKCYNEQIESKNPVYDHLLWVLEEVKVCPKHYAKLEVRCPSCNKQSQPFTGKMRAGFCNSCSGWLGCVQKTNITEEVVSGADLFERVETAILIGEMLAYAPYTKKLFSKEHIGLSLQKFTEQLHPQHLHIFAKLIKVSPSLNLISKSGKGKDRVQLGVLIRICKVFGSSVSEFLKGHTPDVSTLLQSIESLYIEKKNEVIFLKAKKKNEIIRRLHSALSSPDHISVTELARELGYKSPKSLRNISAELCKQIVAKNKASGYKTGSEIGPKNSYYPDHIRVVLVDAICEEPPPTVKDVSLRVDYKNEIRFRAKYPDVTKLLMTRRREYRRAEYTKIEASLLDALKEEPPPSRKEVFGRLTYKEKPLKSVQNFASMFPAHCRAITARYKSHKSTKRVSI